MGKRNQSVVQRLRWAMSGTRVLRPGDAPECEGGVWRRQKNDGGRVKIGFVRDLLLLSLQKV